MAFDWSIVTDKLYGIVKGSAKKLSMYDARGNETIDPSDATRFFATFSSSDPDLDDFTILVAIHDLGQSSYINIKTPSLDDDRDFDKVHQIRNHIRSAVGQREGIKTVWQKFDQEIDPREEAVHNIKESKDMGKWHGTTKSSFQKIGTAKLIIRHTGAVNENLAGARTRHIRALFVESDQGERFVYPYLHMSGARAFARHISNGGTNHDTVSQGITKLSGDYMSLRRASHAMRQNGAVSGWTVSVRESMNSINGRLKSLQGPKGHARAERLLANQHVILDETTTNSLWQRLAEVCGCDQEQPLYSDLGVAARYLSGVDKSSHVVKFSWHRRPDISGVAHTQPVLARLHLQLIELADACSDSHAAARLREIAAMLGQNRKPSTEDLAFVREAIASGTKYTTETELPEEREIDEFLMEFSLDKMFTTDASVGSRVDSIDEAFETDTSDYEMSHGKKPRGSGGWVIGVGSKDAKDHVEYSGSLSDALQRAKQVARDKGLTKSSSPVRLHVMSENDTYGVKQKKHEREDEIAYNKEQRAKRWNFGDPLPDSTPADNDLEEMEKNSMIQHIPGQSGKVINQSGDFYLVHDEDNYDRTIKHEYIVYQKTGERFKEIENLNMPYQRPSEAMAVFKKKYMAPHEAMLERMKNLAGI